MKSMDGRACPWLSGGPAGVRQALTKLSPTSGHNHQGRTRNASGASAEQAPARCGAGDRDSACRPRPVSVQSVLCLSGRPGLTGRFRPDRPGRPDLSGCPDLSRTAPGSFWIISDRSGPSAPGPGQSQESQARVRAAARGLCSSLFVCSARPSLQGPDKVHAGSRDAECDQMRPVGARAMPRP